MRTEKEIKALLKEWRSIRQMMIDAGDTVSLIVADHALFYIKILEWVLETDKVECKGVDK